MVFIKDASSCCIVLPRMYLSFQFVKDCVQSLDPHNRRGGDLTTAGLGFDESADRGGVGFCCHFEDL